MSERRHDVGDRVLFLGQEWTVTAAHTHPRLGRFLRLEDEDGHYDLVHEDGSDGGIQALHPIDADDRGARHGAQRDAETPPPFGDETPRVAFTRVEVIA
jgi:hypothetical protein